MNEHKQREKKSEIIKNFKIHKDKATAQNIANFDRQPSFISFIMFLATQQLKNK